MKAVTAAIRVITTLVLALAVSTVSHAQQDPWADSYKLELAGKYADAQALIEPLATRPSPSEFAVLRSAWLLYLQGKYADAEKRYMRAAEINPRSLEAWLGVMLPQMASYKWGDAIKSGQHVTAANTWDYNANVRMMACEEAMSRWSDLAVHAAAMAARYPADATILVYWARAAAAQRDTRKARDLYLQVLERSPGHVEATKYIKSVS
jgi:tetratricopeptide (TPR) repeat protein